MGLIYVNNSTDLLQNYELAVMYVFSESMVWNETIAEQEFIGNGKYWNLGINYFTRATSGKTKKLLEWIYANPELNATDVSMTSCSTISPVFKSTEKYKNFVRTSMSGEFDALLYVLYCRQMGWWKVGLIYSDSEWSREVAKVVKNEA